MGYGIIGHTQVMDMQRFILPDGTEIGTGLQLPDAESIRVSAAMPMYDQNQILDPKDMEKSLGGDRYKTFRRLRQATVINQANLGSCNAAATVAAYMNRRALDGMSNVALSVNHLYSNINGGQDQGSQLVHGLTASAEKGVSPVEVRVNGTMTKFPLNVYNRRQVNAALLKAADEAAKTYESFEAFRVPTTSYQDFKMTIASAIARDQQLVIALHVGNAFMNLRNGYIQQGNGPGNHALCVHSGKWVGGDDLVHPDIQNSWGPTINPLLGPVKTHGWGDDGFGLITMSSLWQCAKYHVFWVFPGNRLKPGAR
jgi:hypothetical protein